MSSSLAHLNPSATCLSLLDLPLSARNKIYLSFIQDAPKSLLKAFTLPHVCRQIQDEFATAYAYHVNARLRCCLGRTLQDRETTGFHAWNYHGTPWDSGLEISPEFVRKLKACRIRCTIEELGDRERRSEPGSDCFKDCIRILVRTFKQCQHMRDLRISFDHFIFTGSRGPLNATETWDRLKGLAGIRGLTEVRFETPGLGADYVWRKEIRGKKSRGEEEWALSDSTNAVRVRGKKERAGEGWVKVVEHNQTSTGLCGARVPTGYGLRRGIT